MVVRCTKKMLDLLGRQQVALVELDPTEGDWYLNLLWIDRRKCLLLTHSGTLFSVFHADIRNGDLRPIGAYLIDAIESELRAEQLPVDTFPGLQADGVLLTKTSSRRTLGFMTEMAAEARYTIADQGGLTGCDIGTINRRLRRTLHNHEGYVTPIELVEAQLVTRS
jgi:Domain of unknown function (DUF6933)